MMEIIPAKSEEFSEVILAPDAQVQEAVEALLGNVAAASRRIYRQDARQFVEWLAQKGLSVEVVNFKEVSDYRAYLEESYAKATASRKLVVARRLLEVAVILKLRLDNPGEHLKGFKQ